MEFRFLGSVSAILLCGLLGAYVNRSDFSVLLPLFGLFSVVRRSCWRIRNVCEKPPLCWYQSGGFSFCRRNLHVRLVPERRQFTCFRFAMSTAAAVPYGGRLAAGTIRRREVGVASPVTSRRGRRLPEFRSRLRPGSRRIRGAASGNGSLALPVRLPAAGKAYPIRHGGWRSS